MKWFKQRSVDQLGNTIHNQRLPVDQLVNALTVKEVKEI